MDEAPAEQAVTSPDEQAVTSPDEQVAMSPGEQAVMSPGEHDVTTADAKTSDQTTTALKKTVYYHRLVNINDMRVDMDYRHMRSKVSRYLPSPFFLDNFGFMGYFKAVSEFRMEVGIYLCQTSGEETLPKPIRCRITMMPLSEDWTENQKKEEDEEFLDKTKNSLRELAYGFYEEIGIAECNESMPDWMLDWSCMFKFTVEYVDSMPSDEEKINNSDE